MTVQGAISWVRIVALVLVGETIHLAAFLAWISRSTTWRMYVWITKRSVFLRFTEKLTSGIVLQPNKFNTTKTFLDDKKYTEDSTFADDLWKYVQPRQYSKRSTESIISSNFSGGSYRVLMLASTCLRYTWALLILMHTTSTRKATPALVKPIDTRTWRLTLALR